MTTQVALKAITSQFLDTAAWADGEDDYSSTQWSDEAQAEALEICTEFVNKAGGLEGELLEQLAWDDIGHNLWLSKQGHGTGFWDRGWGECGDKLHEIAKSMGDHHLYVENELTYLS